MSSEFSSLHSQTPKQTHILHLKSISFERSKNEPLRVCFVSSDRSPVLFSVQWPLRCRRKPVFPVTDCRQIVHFVFSFGTRWNTALVKSLISASQRLLSTKINHMSN
ncbi:hypothetical protein L6452_33572 [Arctium lappa]|uniref:Uncharacterized protein n=1 Tax=Arctium lappa TaxID=4217 RepID=A0ACB8YGD2_ARCLA|nr:hypothetical protein L6452_33572 [Arctium lappa]